MFAEDKILFTSLKNEIKSLIKFWLKLCFMC